MGVIIYSLLLKEKRKRKKKPLPLPAAWENLTAQASFQRYLGSQGGSVARVERLIASLPCQQLPDQRCLTAKVEVPAGEKRLAKRLSSLLFSSLSLYISFFSISISISYKQTTYKEKSLKERKRKKSREKKARKYHPLPRQQSCQERKHPRKQIDLIV